MTDDDNILIDKFFSEVSQQQNIADDGFSRRVMDGLNTHSTRLLHLWTAICVLIGIVLFAVSRFWELIITYVQVFISTAPTFDISQINPLPIVISAVVLLGLFIYEMLDSEKMSL